MSGEQQAEPYFRGLQASICAALENEDGQAVFKTDSWQRPGGGGGISRVLADGAVFEKAGVNISAVHGQFKPEFAASLPAGDGLDFFATGMSLVLHPRNPRVPTVHANFRCLRRDSGVWFGGGYSQDLPLGFSTGFQPIYFITRYDDALPAFGQTRSDDTVMLAFTLLNRRFDYHGFTPRLSYVFTEQHSNIPIYSFTRNQIQIGLTSQF